MSFSCSIPDIWSEHKQVLRNYIKKRVYDEALTDDILQEVIIKLYNSCSSAAGVKNLRAWLFTIAHNTIIDHFRKNKQSYQYLPGIADQSEAESFHEAATLVIPLLSFLPEEYAEPLKLSDIDGLKQNDIASRLGLSLTATKSRIQRARQMLKNKFLICCELEVNKDGGLISASPKQSCKPLQEYLQVKNISCCKPSIEIN